MPLANIPGGLEIHNVEMNPGQGGKLVPLGGRRGTAEREGRGVVGDHSAVRRNAPREEQVPGDDRTVSNLD